MLALSIFHDISIDTYKIVRGGRNKQHSMLSFHWENTASRYNHLQGLLLILMLAPFVFLKSLGS